jgi:hypothetical protein
MSTGLGKREWETGTPDFSGMDYQERILRRIEDRLGGNCELVDKIIIDIRVNGSKKVLVGYSINQELAREELRKLGYEEEGEEKGGIMSWAQA